MQLFALLGFESGSLSKETVTLSHFLNKADAIISSVEKIKALDAMVSKIAQRPEAVAFTVQQLQLQHAGRQLMMQVQCAAQHLHCFFYWFFK